MKKSFSSLLMAVVVALSFLSCSKDASDEENIPVKLRYLIFIAYEDGTFSFSRSGLSFSLDEGRSWTALAAGGSTPVIPAGSTILWKCSTPLSPKGAGGSEMMTGASDDVPLFESDDDDNTAVQAPATRSWADAPGIGTFASSGLFEARGNIMSLLYCDDGHRETSLDGKDYAFYGLFSSSKVVRADSLTLPTMTLPSWCYATMFSGCTELVAPPELPATSLAYFCYSKMFKGCTALADAPELPATELAPDCYNGMFQECSALTRAPELPAEWPAPDCYHGMFQYCTALETAPVLPAGILTYGCYAYMFYGCSSLHYVRAAFTDMPDGDTTCTAYWLYGVADSGAFVKSPDTLWDITGPHGIPSGWTVVTYTP